VSSAAPSLLNKQQAEARPIESPPSSRRPFDLILFVLALAPAAFIIRLVATYGVNVPFGDEWALIPLFGKWADHHLTFVDLFRQHNEHRILVPKLIYLGFVQLTHWNTKAEMFFSISLCGLISACLFRLLRETIPGSLRRHLCLWGAFNLLIFGQAQAENWLWGFQCQMFIPAACLIASLVILTPPVVNLPRFIAVFTLALIATFSFGNGLLLWPLIGFYLSSKTASRRWIILWASLSVIVITVYFFGYEAHLSQKPHPVSALDYGIYFLRFNGNALGQFPFPFPFRLTLTAVVGAGALLAFATTAAMLLRRRGLRGSLALPWIAIGLYAIGSAMIAMIGRIHEGTFQAIDSRYSTISINLFIALTGLIALSKDHGAFSPRARIGRLMPSIEMAYLAFILFWYTAALPGAIMRTEKLSRLKLQGLAHLQFCKIISPSNTLRRSLRINVDFPEFVRDVAIIERLQLLDPPLRTSDLLYDSLGASKPPANEFGRFETVARRGQTLFELSGWAFLPLQNQPAAAVVLAYRTGNAWHAFALADVSEERTGAADKSAGDDRWSGWRRTIDMATLPKGVREISAWGVDAATAEVFKLPGTFALPNE
jgi:hypothetical protein